MMRSEKRPTGRPASAPSGRARRKKSKRHPLYAFFTVLALIVLYPVGLVMLWVRKLRWRSMTKLMLSLVTGVAFFVLCAFALNTPFENEAITDMQTRAKQQLTHVTSAMRTAVSNKETIEYNLTTLGPHIINLAGNAAAQATMEAVPQISENLNLLYSRAGRLSRGLVRHVDHEGRDLLYSLGVLPTPEPTLAPISTPTPRPTAKPTPVVTMAPTIAPTEEPTGVPSAEPTDDQTEPTATAAVTPTVRPTATPTARPTVAAPTRTPAESLVPESQALNVQQSPVLSSVAVSPTPVTPTAKPTPTPVPTPSPTPIILPDIKPFGLTTVYYYDSGRSYHTGPTCSGMSNAPAHTLAEAGEAGKRRCGTCKPPELSMIDAEMIVWCGDDEVFHITDECAALTETWTALPFDEAWLEDGMTGCALCGADLYVESGKLIPAATPVPAPVT